MRFAIGLLVTAQLAHAAPEALQAVRKDLAAAMRAEDEARRLAGDNFTSRVAVLLRNLDSAVQKESQSYVESALQSLAEAYRSDDVQVCVVKLREELNAEAQRKQDDALAECEALLNEVRETLVRATQPAELDPLIDKLDRMKPHPSGETPQKLQEALQSLRNARRMVANWQDSLQAAANGNGQAAVQSLRNVLSSDGPMLVPRSFVLERIQELQGTESGFADLVAGIKELDDIAPALAAWWKLEAANRGSSTASEITATVRALDSINRDYRQFKTGLPTGVDLGTTSSGSSLGPYEGAVISLKAKLWLMVLPRYVGAPEGTTANPGEEILPFLKRLGREAKERGDGVVAMKANEAARLMLRSYSFSNLDTQALKDFMAGQNQEAAGQIMLAVRSYQEALKSGSDLVSAKIIGMRLDELKKTHPEDFEKGMKMFLYPTPPADYEPMGLPPSLRSRYGFPGRHGFPDREPAEPSGPAILIPQSEVSAAEKPAVKDEPPAKERPALEKPRR